MDQYRSQPQITKPESSADSSSAVNKARVKKSNKKPVIVAVVSIALLLAIGIGLAYTLLYDNKNQGTSLIGVNSDRYQALFLTNGQVYFGDLSEADDKTVKLENIYYLQVQQAVQPEEQSDNNEESPQEGETSLVKLGEELHGPEDEMYIDRDQVLFWENMKDDGDVVKAINEYQKQN